MNTMKNINDLINSQLTRSIKTNDKLSDFVYGLLHLKKEKHNLWVNTKQQKLTILTDNPYLATQINYQKDTICKEVNRKFLMTLKQSSVKIIPPTGTKQKKQEECFKMSGKTAEMMMDIASDIQDTELKKQLMSLVNKKL